MSATVYNCVNYVEITGKTKYVKHLGALFLWIFPTLQKFRSIFLCNCESKLRHDVKEYQRAAYPS